MRNLFITSLLVLGVSLYFSQNSFAECENNGQIPPGGGNTIVCADQIQNVQLSTTSPAAVFNRTTVDGDEVIVEEDGGVDVSGVTAIDTNAGEDMVHVNGVIRSDIRPALETGMDNDEVMVGPGADISGRVGIGTSGGNDKVVVDDGRVAGAGPGSAAIATGGENDDVEINGGSLSTTGTFIVSTSLGEDTLVINDGLFGEGTFATQTEDDDIIISGGTFSNNIIDAGFDDDSVEIASDIRNLGNINCDEGDDTLILSMGVRQSRLAGLAAEFEAEGDDGSININGITYTWTSCENRIANFSITVSSVPTLSEWGMIAMAGLLGIIGFMVIRRKQATA